MESEVFSMKKEYEKKKKLVIFILAAVAVCLAGGLCLYLVKIGTPKEPEKEPVQQVTEQMEVIVRRATIVSFITLMVFTFSGQFLFKFFGISSNGFRIAGGFIIFKIGFDMLQARYSNAKLKEEEVKTYADDISITPLAIPMLCGPGAIANAIMLMDDASTLSLKGTLIGIIALVYFITFLILQASTRLVRILGETGNNVMMRLMGLILMVIAVECFVSGLKPILIDILREAMG